MNNLITNNHFICNKCFGLMDPNIKKFKVSGVSGISLCAYNEFTRNIILNIKVNKDLTLAKHLLTPWSAFIKEQYRGYTMVGVPSTDKSNQARGFNHVEAIFSQLKMPVQSLFTKSNSYKQTKVSFNERELVKNYIALKPGVLLPKRILIVDDIITSGSSLTTCLNLIKQYKEIEISFIVFSNNCRN